MSLSETLSVFCLQASPLLSCPALACPLLRSAARHRVAPVECDDHGLDKALHSWPFVPLWKSAPGSRDHRVRVASVYLPLACPVRQALPTPAPPHDCQQPHQPHTSLCCISFTVWIHATDDVQLKPNQKKMNTHTHINRMGLLSWFGKWKVFHVISYNGNNNLCTLEMKQLARNRIHSATS